VTDTTISPRKLIRRGLIQDFHAGRCFNDSTLEQIVDDLTRWEALARRETKLPEGAEAVVRFGHSYIEVFSLETDAEYTLRTADRHVRALAGADLAIQKAADKLEEALKRRARLEEQMNDPNFRG